MVESENENLLFEEHRITGKQQVLIVPSNAKSEWRGEVDGRHERKRSIIRYAVYPSLSSAMSGYCGGVMSGAVLFIKQEFKFNDLLEEVLMGSFVIVSFVGGIIAGFLADSIGRKKTIVVSAAIVLSGCIVIGLAPSYWFILTGRLLTGIGSGFPYVIVPLYISEISPPESRGMLVTFPEIFVNSGILLGYLSGFCLAPLPVSVSWRLMLAIGGLLAVLVACIAAFMPESPRWLVLQNRKQEAIIVLVNTSENDKKAHSRLATIISAATDANEESTSFQPVDASESDIEEAAKVKIQRNSVWRHLIWPNARVRNILFAALGLQFFQQTSGIAAILYYAPSIFEKAGLTSKTGVLGGTLAVGVSKTLCILVATYWIDRCGRKPLLLFSGLGMTVSMTMLATVFFYVSHQSEISSSLPGFLATAASCVFVAAFSMGFGPICGLISSEIFPLRLRAQGMSLAVALNRLMSGIMATSFLTLSTILTLQGSFLLFAAMSALSMLFVYLFIPETKGRSLEDII
ncbi:hypothetical protein O6H91_03G121500 [Diphasiastrum complanatum]|uniref:Uncharacterized protein n=1 Tax=Diphasiastrum complanatum TaxID=34168 RepID=A0ACC2EBE4_DIPCM|nr:hypothetical protein O6H91_03G121500 [Diphasiastrum complanatum]